MIEDHFAIFQGQHTFWGGGERKDGGGEILLSELLCVMEANTHRPTV
jgi:hypothetical protein